MIIRGDSVRVKIYRERAKRRELVATKIGTVELAWGDQVVVRFDGEHKPRQFQSMDVEKVGHGNAS